ncbi:lytic transglycosylase domain-containing protein [Oscillospiraceae bacterium OttesenSCG-928-G22]|nr:lytic transglycosylase domain-containing protein [Oscillospiraceae bacterium OttesenSCG-928-G22]
MSGYASAIWKARMAELDARIQGRLNEISSKTGLSFENAFTDAVRAVSDMDTASTSASNTGAASTASGVDADTILGLMGMNGGNILSGLTGSDSDSSGLSSLLGGSGTDLNSLLTGGTSGNSLLDALQNSLGGSGKTDALSSKYDSLIETISKKYGASPDLVKALCKAESGFNASAVSSAGAVGLMQLMPATCESLGVTDPYDAAQNVEGGVICLVRHLSTYDGSVPMALAAYNCGAGTLSERGITDLSDPVQFQKLPAETRSFLNKIHSYLASVGKGSVYTGQ